MTKLSSPFYFSDSLAFATEPVFASLANVLGNYERLPANIPQEIKVYNARVITHFFLVTSIHYKRGVDVWRGRAMFGGAEKWSQQSTRPTGLINAKHVDAFSYFLGITRLAASLFIGSVLA